MFRSLLPVFLLAACNRGTVDLVVDEGCVDEGVLYLDGDGDGYGDDAAEVDVCDAPADAVEVGGDCDDRDRTVHPGAVDECGDGVDRDCDGLSDRCNVSLADAAAKLVGGANSVTGDSVAGTGDINGDGVADILVGAPGTGVAFFVPGPVHGTLDLSDETVAKSWSVGLDCMVAVAGDVDGDGFDDVVLGDPYAEAALLLYGPLDGEVDPAFRSGGIYGETAFDRAGGAVSGVGDTNGDGRDDLLIGAYGNDEGGDDAGAAYLVLGPISGHIALTTAAARLIGEDAGDDLGRRVSSAGDADGDGLADLLVGAPYAESDGAEAGAAYLVLSPVSGTVSLSAADAKLVGEGNGDRAGGGIASAGDMDGDGRDDLFVGAYANDTGGRGTGTGYLVLSPVSGTMDLSSADAMLLGERGYDHVGNAVSSAGDVDGDGHLDLIMGAVRDDDGGEDAGAAYLVFGPITGTISLADANVKLIGESVGAFAGDSVSAAGDMNDDGFGDILVGASNDNEGGGYAGAAYLVLGGQW